MKRGKEGRAGHDGEKKRGGTPIEKGPREQKKRRPREQLFHF